jgi:two-component system response regulator
MATAFEPSSLMKVVSGLDMLKLMKSDNKINQIPVVVLTSSLDENDQLESFQLGADDYIRKPTGFSQFVDIVQNIRKRWLNGNGKE